jgi:hypothetical protein
MRARMRRLSMRALEQGPFQRSMPRFAAISRTRESFAEGLRTQHPECTRTERTPEAIVRGHNVNGDPWVRRWHERF